MWAGRSEEIEQIRKMRKRTHGHEQRCGDCGGEGGVVEEAIREINGDGNKYINK